MEWNKSFVRVNKTSIAICIFLAVFLAIHALKPAIFYTPEGGFREFGDTNRKPWSPFGLQQSFWRFSRI
jgi:hypothetical protein